MNVKTAHRGYPKDALLREVEEIKGTSAAAKAARAQRRGKLIAFIKEFFVGSRSVKVLAAGHNKKVPLLLVGTHSSMLPGEEHKKTWRTPAADGSEVFHTRVTKQPQMHALYRKWMNVVDLHNKLRQGVACMADVWQTKSWADRHFSEGIGLVEVNAFKAVHTFFPQWHDDKLTHSEFRRRFAWSFLTLGKVAYPSNMFCGDAFYVPPGSNMRSQPADFRRPVAATPVATGSSFGSWSSATPSSSEQHSVPSFSQHFGHVYEAYKGHGHTCAYCGHTAWQYCSSCFELGRGQISVCGRRTKRDCMDKHACGEEVSHVNWAQRKKPK